MDNLKKDLETLYEKGYRPISLTDYVTGNITTELGYTPVVLTFDDGNLNIYKFSTYFTIFLVMQTQNSVVG